MVEKEKQFLPLNSLKLSEKISSQADFDEDEQRELDENSCGLGSFHPKCLQWFAKRPSTFTLIYSFAGIVSSISFSYFSSTISTLEKRFSVSSKTIASLLVVSDVSTLLFSLFISYYGGSRHRARIIGIGVMLWCFSNLLTASPQLFYGSKHLMEFIDGGQEKPVALCNENDEANQSYVDQNCNKYESLSVSTGVSLALMACGIFISNIGSVIYYTLGSTYVDDNLDKRSSSLFYSILSCIRTVGWLLGYLFGSFTLSYYQDINDDRGLVASDERWVGCWWLGYIIISCPALIIGFILLWFPKSFRRKSNRPKLPEENKMMTNFNDFEKTELEKARETDTSWAALPKRLKHLAKNPVLVCLCLKDSAAIFSLYGIIAFNPKYLEEQFQVTASKAVFYHGCFVIISACGGCLIGGAVTRCLKPGPRKIMIYDGILSLIYCGIFVAQITIKCDPLIESQNPFFNISSEIGAECRADCSCDLDAFDPICVTNTQTSYFSPCILGCTDIQENVTKLYGDCKCLEEVETSLQDWIVIGGHCQVDCKSPLFNYLILVALLMTLVGSSAICKLLVSLRCVDKADKTLAQGVQTVVMTILAFIPSPLVYGEVYDSSCKLWDYECGHKKNCLVYNLDQLRFTVHFACLTGFFISAVTSLVAAKYANRIKKLYDNENDFGYR